MTIAQIPLLLKNSQTIALEHAGENYPVLVVKNHYGVAKIALHGAHLYEWTPTGHEPVIYTSPTAIFKEGKAIRGGIPVCWPWFNAHPSDPSLPAHGFARNRFWELTEVYESADGTKLTFYIEADDSTQQIWKHSFSTSLTITVGKKLTIELYTENIGGTPFTVGGALHTYLSTSDLAQTTIEGLDGASYLDTVGEESVKTQHGTLSIEGEVDRIYLDHDTPITLVDSALNRNIEVERSGSKSAVVWNPWVEKSQQLGDLPDDGYQDFICIEAANAREDVYCLEPGQSHTLSTTISVSTL